MISVMGTIFFLSHQAGDTLVLPSFPGADKLAHMLAYGTLALTVLWYYGKKGTRRMKNTALLTMFICFGYGLSDEIHQYFIPLRSVSFFDVMADTAGAAIIVFLWLSSEIMQRKISVM